MGKAKNPNVSKLLDQVHKRMRRQYFPSGQLNEDKKNARILQDFLYQIKQHAMARDTDNSAIKVQKDIYDLILDNVVLPNGRSISKLFTRVGKYGKITGQYFEDDFAALLASVVNLTQSREDKVSIENFSLGDVAGTTSAKVLEQATNDEIKNYVKTLQNVTQEELKKNNPGFVLGKIDTFVDGEILNMNASIEFPPGVLEALSNATFSDKAYRSKKWDKTTNQLIQVGEKFIHLGNSNPYRAVLGVMSNLGFSEKQSQYVFYGGRNIFQGLDTDPPPEQPDYVRQHIYHIRYVYELTGAGILYKDYGSNFASGAKYLVYNDPDSDLITVVATAEIIQDLLEGNEANYPDDPYGLIGIGTSTLKKMARAQL